MDVLEQLLDRELPHEERERIKETLLACPGVQGVHLAVAASRTVAALKQAPVF